MDIDANLPIFVWFGSTTLRNSRINSRFTGDGINIKSGSGLVENCVFTGAANLIPTRLTSITSPTASSVVIASTLSRLETAMPLMLARGVRTCWSGNRIYHMFDKGVSVGRPRGADRAQPDRQLRHRRWRPKDSGSTAFIDQKPFARDNVGVAVYEKNLGNGGGIAFVTNSIFYRSKTAPSHGGFAVGPRG